tara:strand:+ start:10325 stop:10876 length:552 start_codon:yes stop_codon:yes gene_type:complete
MILQNAIDKIQSCNDIYLIKDIANSVNSNQIKNKEWLCENLEPYLDMLSDPKIVVAAGWHGLTAHMLDRNVVSFDMDDNCKKVKLFQNVKYRTSKIEDFDPWDYDVIICTSCEHITDDVINCFIQRKKDSALVVLQSNNYYNIADHINCKQDCDEFAKSINIKILEKHTLELEKYNRFMIFGI